MKLRELLEKINKYVESNPEILDYSIYTEQLNEKDKNFKRKPSRSDIPWYHEDNGQGWEHIKDSDEWEYFEVWGENTIFNKEKIFTININY